ncbi:WASH complex subunit 3 [Macrobrachium rosenbergii]|uniref:WASH complex subunit 3 n=1 Tax=Macrobrachium rosenbergii TaxID=79674 RepID=UPI0034D61F58
MIRSSLVTPHVDLSKVEAINQKRTLAFINHWVLHTVGFLNQFSAVCEERLISLNTKLRRADQSLAILEAKLNSVPDLEGVNAPTIESVQPSDNTDSAATTESNSLHNQTLPGLLSPEASEAQSEESKPHCQEANKEENEGPQSLEPVACPVSKDPRFASYFKMLAVGVPLPAVQMKMRNEGLDPSILEDPNAPAPPPSDDHTQDDDSDSSSVSSFSE